MSVEEEKVVPRKMVKNYRKSKKNESNDLMEVLGFTDAASKRLKDSSKVSEHDKKKKNEKKHEVGGDTEFNGICDKAVKEEDRVKVDGDAQKNGQNKKKKKKRKLEFGEEITDYTGAASIVVDNNFNLSKENRKEKKKQKVDGDLIFDGTCDEALNGKGYVEVNDDLQKEKGEKKTKLESGGDDKDALDSGNGNELKPIKDKKRRHEKRKKDGTGTVSSSMETFEGENTGIDGIIKGYKSFEEEDIIEMKKGAKQEKSKNGRRDIEDSDFKGKKKTEGGKEVAKSREDHDGGVMEKIKSKNRKKKEKIKAQDNGAKNGNTGKRKKTNLVENDSENPKPKGKSKKVTFSGHVEVFPSSDDQSTGKERSQEDDLVRGKRFSKEEDKIVKEAVLTYISEHGLGEEGLNTVLHCKSHPEVRNCWKEIGACLPYRPYTAVYYRAHNLFERDENHKWTKEEYELIRKYQEEHGNDWKTLADELGKHRFHVKDTWRRIKLANMKKGQWSQEEYQTLFDLVNMDLRTKAFEEKKSKHGMLRDNICWGAISDKLSTRANANCCVKWYNQLTSSMVAEGIWGDADDYRLLRALINLDACCVEDVNWDDLLDHRSGDICRKRWDQMVLHIGHHGNKSFTEQIETLAERYCPNLLEARETWDSKPVVP